MVICLDWGADLQAAQLMPLPLIVSCFSEIQIGFTFLVPAHPGSPGKRAVKWVCVCACVRACVCVCMLGVNLFKIVHCCIRNTVTAARSRFLVDGYPLAVAVVQK